MGQAIAGVGLWWLAGPGLTEPSQYWTQFLLPLTLLGIGMGLTIAPLSTTVMNSVVSSRSGLASGINSTLSRLSSVLAVAILGGIALLVFRDSLTARTGHMAKSDQQAVMAESHKLGAAEPPTNLAFDARSDVERSLRLAFVDSFRVVCYVSSGLAGLSALIALVLMRNKVIAE